MASWEKETSQFKKNLAEAETEVALEAVRVKYLGKRGILRALGREVRELSPEQRKEFGQRLNQLKQQWREALAEKAISLRKQEPARSRDIPPRLLPGEAPPLGHLHIITQAIEEISKIFIPLGFNRMRYPEVDWEYYAFDALNMKRDHPARDEFETFFVDSLRHPQKGRAVITPHTSNGQVRHLLRHKPPVRMLNIARCGRRQIDVSHNPSFYQFEGLVVARGINIAHLKGTLTYFARNFFGNDRQIRLRPYDFRFTEPSFEVDVSCGICHGKGCRTCKGGWMELGGAGMVHPYVLEQGGVNPREFSGFAFGWGVERTYMMKSGTKLNDIRTLFDNRLEVLEQF